MTRRDILKTSLATFLALNTSACASKKSTNINKQKINTKNPKIVIVGGGWSGLSVAKNIKKFVPHSEVTLIEKRDHFVSCPVSNPWLFGMINLDFLTHSYIDAAKNHNYKYIQATAHGLDKKNNILKTTQGDIEFDYLVFATGIEYDYDEWCKGDKELEQELKTNYPAAFIPGSEHLSLKRKIGNFKQGNFILTVPAGNYRCLPAPYERACLLAEHFKTNKLDAKVYLLDANNKITIKEDGFSSAMKELYSDYLVYISDAPILEFDLKNKIVKTEFDEIKFEDAAFYPRVKAPKLLEDLNLTIKTPYNRVEANLNHYTNQFIGYDNIYGCGDIRPMGFSKSGNTAYTEGENVAKNIANAIYNKPSKWVSPITVCISIISKQPDQEISLVSQYKYGKNGETNFNGTVTDEAWKTNNLGSQKAQFSWAQSMYDSMFYG